MADVTTRDNVAGSVAYGADPEMLAAALAEAHAIIKAYFADDQKREIRTAEVDRWHRAITLSLVAVAGALLLQTILLAVTLAALVSLLWPRLSAYLL